MKKEMSSIKTSLPSDVQNKEVLLYYIGNIIYMVYSETEISFQ